VTALLGLPIEDIDGIGAVMGEKSRSAGVKDTDSLLQNALTPKQRKELAEKTGLSEARILKFANMADLYRISGVGSEYSGLLEAAPASIPCPNSRSALRPTSPRRWRRSIRRRNSPVTCPPRPR